MKNFLYLLLLIMFTASVAAAESSVWKVHKEGTTIYLGGTCHLLRESDFPLPAEFERAYRNAQVAVFETDIAKLQDPATQAKLLAMASYSDGTTIEQHLSAKTYKELQAYCRANGIPLEALKQFKPSMMMVTLSFMELLKMGVTQQGVDHLFYGRATKEKKKIEGLESADQQINYLVSMAEGNEDEYLAYSLKEMKSVREQFEALIAAWRAGDAEKLNELMVSELKLRQPSIYKRLIVDRNKNWMPLIESYKKSQGVRFVLVGVAHLVGPDGIIEMLKKKGFKVEKL